MQYLGAEGIGQQAARNTLGQAAALQIKHLVGIKLANGCAMRAFHIIGKDFELRLGIDARAL